MYVPPWPGEKQTSPALAAATAPAAQVLPEERPAGLVGDDEGEHREDRRQVDDDLLRIGARDLRDECEKPVPERERVPGVQAPVRELRDTVEGEVVELQELARAGEVEEAVAVDVPRNAPE